VPDKVYLATGLERTNVYDGDKFDVMRNDEFGGLVKKNGNYVNKKTPKTFHELMNDKMHVKVLKERYTGYGFVADTVNSDGEADYDDEYDDSYEVFADTEPKIHLRGQMRDMLPVDAESSEEESEEEPTAAPEAKPPRPGVYTQQRKSNMDFCENPEVIRARREREFQNRQAKKHPNRPVAAPPQERDVVGGQKGQGQSSEVLRNRQKKGVNKSVSGNHSRKAGSAFKQSRGMF